ncbi:MAG: ABC transporter permease subunit [Brevundimonas sp.]
MWADATRAEAFRLIHSRTTWFWSVLFLPILTLVFGVIASYVVKANTERLAAETDAPPELTAMLAEGPLNLGESLLANAAELAGPGLLLFVLIGAATVYAGDYRWETWRLLRPRSGRVELIIGKVLVVTALSVTAMAVLALASLMSEAVRGFVFERSLTFSLDGDQLAALFGLWGLAFLRAAQFLMLSLLAAIFTRSLLAALFVPLAVGVAQFFAPNVLGMMGQTPDSWLTVLASPGHAMSLLQGFLDPNAVTLTGQGTLAAKAWTSLVGWTVLPLAAALVLFQRQDLSKE